MTTRIVLLRGINVSGQRKIPMAELRDALTTAGFDDVRTYIQSGNVVLAGGPTDDAQAGAAIEQAIADRFALSDVPVLVRSPDALRRVRARSGELFSDDGAERHGARVHVVFLATPPSPVRRASLAAADFGDDRFHLDIHDGAAELHVHYAEGAGSSKLTLDRIERAYGVHATGRNLNTIDKLVAMTD